MKELPTIEYQPGGRSLRVVGQKGKSLRHTYRSRKIGRTERTSFWEQLQTCFSVPALFAEG